MRNVNRGWFITEGRDGDRTLDQQMVGLEALVGEVPGKRVLDFGCAEGLIGMVLMEAGAASVTGIDSIDDHLVVGRRMAQDRGIEITLVQANLNDYDVSALAPVDIVLLLAILHKLHNPSAFAHAAAKLAGDLVVIRLPPAGLVIRDMRSLMMPHDIGAVMADEGFVLEFTVPTTNDEWLGYFRRPKAAATQPDIAPIAAPAEAVAPLKFEPAPTSAPKPAADETQQQDAAKPAAESESKPVVLTHGDSVADIAGKQRPDNHDAPAPVPPEDPALTAGDVAADLADAPRPDNPSASSTASAASEAAETPQRTRRARASKE